MHFFIRKPRRITTESPENQVRNPQDAVFHDLFKHLYDVFCFTESRSHSTASREKKLLKTLQVWKKTNHRKNYDVLLSVWPCVLFIFRVFYSVKHQHQVSKHKAWHNMIKWSSNDHIIVTEIFWGIFHILYYIERAKIRNFPIMVCSTVNSRLYLLSFHRRRPHQHV